MCGIGRSVVLAKFAHTPGLKQTLLATGNAILAEATRNDRNWGIGLNLDHPDLASPRKWQGANILGWSLMEARHELGGAPPPGGGGGGGVSGGGGGGGGGAVSDGGGGGGGGRGGGGRGAAKRVKS